MQSLTRRVKKASALSRQAGEECQPESFNASITCPAASCHFNEYHVNANLPRLQVRPPCCLTL